MGPVPAFLGGAAIAAGVTTAGLLIHDKNVVDRLHTAEDKNRAVDLASRATDGLASVGFGTAVLASSTNLKSLGWGVTLGSYAAQLVTENLVLGRVEDKGNRWNPFDNHMKVGPQDL